ncbi:MAG TPA: dipeptidase [Candidatus Baltobacteraceae bacterium]|nr:dipeptidase [Candidatus Baltobacteraceae bacterium]
MAEAKLSVASGVSSRARDLHLRSLVIDTHVDTTQRLLAGDFDLGAAHGDGSIDIPRMREGGVGAIFFAIWIRGTITGPEAVQRALVQIEAIHRSIARHPQDLVLARSSVDILRARADGRIAILLGLEGGHMLNHDLGVLRRYADLGVRYMTLTHVHNTDWADASTAAAQHNGLSDFGKGVIREMNGLGMAVDVSHASDKAVVDVLETSAAPVFASHSSCHALCATPRNLRDDLIRALAAKGGVVQINFNMGFISQEFRDAEKANPELGREIEEEARRRAGSDTSRTLIESAVLTRDLVAQGKLPRVDWTDILDHIDHAVKIAGVEHVGLGSDFDGADMPYGMEDASHLPQITDALLDRGYSEENIQRILGGNTLRFLQNVEAFAKSPAGNP